MEKSFIATHGGEKVLVDTSSCRLNSKGTGLLVKISNTNNGRGNIDPRWVNAREIRCSSEGRRILGRLLEGKIKQKRGRRTRQAKAQYPAKAYKKRRIRM